MISDVDNVLRELLIREIPIRKGEVEIAFDLPKREWSSQLNKPTLNLFLFDIKENLELRGSERHKAEKREDGSIAIKRNSVRVDLNYLITSWTRDVQDQHRLLSGALLALLRNSTVPDNLLPERLQSQPVPIRLKVAQGEIASNITDLWSTLDNELRPGIRLTVTVSFEPFSPEVHVPVQSVEIDFTQLPSPDALAARGESIPPERSRSYHAIGGRVRSQKYSPALLKIVLRETAEEIALSPEGEFKISWLQEGEYHLDIFANGRVLKQQKIRVPSSHYEIEI
jgi:hypothetical protein